MSRAQANLPALAVALVVLTSTAGLSVAFADAAFEGADRDPPDRRVAAALSDRLVAAGSPTTRRANVLREGVLSLTAAELDRSFPVARGHAVRIDVGDEAVLERGDPTGGATVRRVVLVARLQTVTLAPTLDRNATTLPRRTDRITLTVDPGNATVRTVRANDRVVLHDPSGLNGTYDVRVSRFETLRLTYETDRPLERGSVELTYYPVRTTKATLAVTVDV
ncbi:MAG: hypothetical protein V5A62_16385 [Haloarculaceae archaeon]